MKILILGPQRPQFRTFIASFDDQVIEYEKPLKADSLILDHIDFIISYGYRHIINKDIINKYPRKIINLHISLLPWNKGSDPNLWSFLENTPKGVTIHYIDEGLDTGDILCKKEVRFGPNETLKSSYGKLTKEIEALFIEFWPDIRQGRVEAKPQLEMGSCHCMVDKNKFGHLLIKGWDTPVALLTGKAL